MPVDFARIFRAAVRREAERCAREFSSTALHRQRAKSETDGHSQQHFPQGTPRGFWLLFCEHLQILGRCKRCKRDV